jgi:hypothetical protein
MRLRSDHAHHGGVGNYREFRAPSGLACVWTRIATEDGVALVAPDGCADLIWSDASAELLIAGPDTGAHPTALSPSVA